MEIIESVKDWQGKVTVGDRDFPSISDALQELPQLVSDGCSIILHPVIEEAPESVPVTLETDTSKQYRVTVKAYMTKPSSPTFDFMSVWNGNTPMPLRTMVGYIEKETHGMVFMRLHGDITSTLTTRCLKCGKAITNPVSQFFGMGPECGGHNYVNPFDTDEELQAAVENYRISYLNKIEWAGWIVKSAIIEQEEIK